MQEEDDPGLELESEGDDEEEPEKLEEVLVFVSGQIPLLCYTAFHECQVRPIRTAP